MWWLAQRGMEMGTDCWIQNIMVPRNAWDIKLGDGVMIDRHGILLSTGDRKQVPRITIYDGVYINRFSFLDATEKIEIGAHTMIGPHCYITDHDHGFDPDEPLGRQPMDTEPTTIGTNVWVGAGVAVLKGVNIGDGAVIGAGAVVTSSVEKGAKVAGVPGRQIGWCGKRQDSEASQNS